MRARRSLLTPLGILGVLHFYVGWRLLPDLPIGTVGSLAGALLLAFSTVAIPMGFQARSMKSRRWADAIAAVGLFMMGFFSSLFVFTLLRDVALLVALPFLSSPRVQ